MKIEAEVKNLKSILIEGDKLYQIPNYQRPYKWDKDNLSDLLDDLITAFTQDPNNDYFCGSLVLVQNQKDKRFDIIDGQQRMTTFTILSCVLRDIYFASLDEKSQNYILDSIKEKYDNKEPKLKLKTDQKHELNFRETVIKKIEFQKTKDVEKNSMNNRYLINAHYLRDLLDEKSKEEPFDINKFVKWIFEHVDLTVINCPSEDVAIQIFNVLNNRGMPLSPIDILKSSLMQKIDNDEDKELFKTDWDAINNKLESFGLKLEDVLNSFLYFKLASNPESRLDKQLLTIFNAEKKTALENLFEISKFSNAYISVLSENNRHIHCLQYLRHKIYWTSIVTSAHFVNYKHIESLYSLLVAYYYQNWIAGETIARIKQVSFNIIKLIKANASIEAIKTEMNDNLQKYVTTKKYQEEISGNYVYGKAWDKPLLLLIQYFSEDKKDPNFIKLERNLQVEHILPQTPNDHWATVITREDREYWTNALANLTLLSDTKNVQAKNYEFDKKKDVYLNKNNVASSFKLTKDICDYQVWNTESLKNRKRLMLQKTIDVIELF